jgi:hypothetical protein
MRREPITIYLEIGQKKVFAGAVEWPGWCRAGRDEAAAIQALLAYGPRYGRILQAANISFQAPTDTAALAIVERLAGNATTDFGAPDAVPASDIAPFSENDLPRYEMLLPAYWQGLDTAVQLARGKELRKGPRGGGRDLEKIMEHVLGAEASYLRQLGWKHKVNSEASPHDELKRIRPEILEALAAAAGGELPQQGPRGGTRWPPRYFIRRSVWHLLDHAWEIEDRIVEGGE